MIRMWNVIFQILIACWTNNKVEGCLRGIRVYSGPIFVVESSNNTVLNMTTPVQLNITRLEFLQPSDDQRVCNASLEISIPNDANGRTTLGRFHGNEISEFEFPYSKQFMFTWKFGDCNTSISDTYLEYFYSECGRLYTDNSGFIFPHLDVPGSAVCIYRIRAKNGRSISLLLLDSLLRITETGSCNRDLWLFSNRTNRPKMCVSGSQHLGTTKGQELLILYANLNDTSIEGQLPFTIFYTVCGAIYNQSRGTIESPMYPYSHPGRFNCSYIVDPPEKASISIRLNSVMNGDCSANSLEIRRGYSSSGEMISRFCDSREDYSFTSPGSMWIQFIKTDNTTISSFQIAYSDSADACSTTITTTRSSSIRGLLIGLLSLFVGSTVGLVIAVILLMLKRAKKTGKAQPETVNERYETLQGAQLNTGGADVYTPLQTHGATPSTEEMAYSVVTDHKYITIIGDDENYTTPEETPGGVYTGE